MEYKSYVVWYIIKRRGEKVAVFTIADLHLSLGTNKPMDVLRVGIIILSESKKTGQERFLMKIQLLFRAIFLGR